MGKYDVQKKAAAKAIKNKGMLVQHVRRSHSGSYNPATDSYTETEIVTSVYAVRATSGVNEQRLYGFGIGSSMLYLGADVLSSVSVGDAFRFCGEQWEVSKVSETAPAEDAVLFAVELAEAGSHA